VAAVCDAHLHGGNPEGAWRIAQEHLALVEAPSLLRLELGKIAAKSGLHRTEGLAALDQVLKEPLEGGSSGYGGAWWRRGQILKDLGRKDEARKAAQEALRLDPRHRGARELMDALQHTD
jgi:tetratricopeptide (TPR) repeat protein